MPKDAVARNLAGSRKRDDAAETEDTAGEIPKDKALFLKRDDDSVIPKAGMSL